MLEASADPIRLRSSTAAASGRGRRRRGQRPMRLLSAGLLAASLVVAGSAPALAIEPAPSHLPQDPRVDITEKVVDLTFPVAQPASVAINDSFLALRGGGTRLHAATDMMTAKHRPIHAAVGGTIHRAPYPEPHYGWMISLHGDDGRRYAYVHMNNDTREKDGSGNWLDDDQGGVERAYAPRIVDAIRAEGSASGLRVERGELLGWVGDSGNAKHIASHLHFEMYERDSEGEYRINPYHSLVAARERGDVPGSVTPIAGGGATTSEVEGPYRDLTAGGAHTEPILALTEAGIVTGCADERYCPDDAVTRGDLARFLTAALELVADDVARFDDVSDDDPNAPGIAAVAEAGIMQGYGDGRFGADDALSRAQLATMLVQGFDVAQAATAAPFADVLPEGVHSANIAAAYEAGLTTGCEDGSIYCGERDVTRGQIASFLARALA